MVDFNVDDFNVRLRTIKIRNLVVGIILAIIITAILMAVFPVIYEDDDLFFFVIVALILLFFAWALRGTHGLKQNFSNLFEDETKKEIIYVFLINILFACLFMLLISGLDILSGIGDPNWAPLIDIDSVDVGSGILLWDVITSIIFAPLMEELIFRGVLFNRLKIRTGIIPAMLISSFLFGIGHEFGGMTSAFLFGICMCILYTKTDNILVPMSVHFINNVVAVLLEVTHIDVIGAQFPWIIPSLIIVLIGTVYLIKYIIGNCRKLKKEYS